MSEIIEIKNDQDGMIEINLNRLNYLLDLLDISKEDLVEKLNEGRKRLLNKEDVSGETLELSVLKRIDKILQQGLSYYTDSINPPSSKKGRSILFRKSKFNADLEFADRLQVYKIERQIVKLNALAKLSEYPEFRRKPQLKASINDIPEDVAKSAREILYPDQPSSTQKGFLEKLINKLAEYDILVFEYTETWNQINRTSIAGFFISPNVITIKRQQQSFTREIFTLAHELAHYLLDSEELDRPVVSQNSTGNKIEYWCNAFAFAFLFPEESRARLYEEGNLGIDSNTIMNLVKTFHISRLAIFTHLALEGKIEWQEQQSIQRKLDKWYQKLDDEKEMGKQLAKARGEKPSGGGVPKPIHSELEKEIYRYAYLDGVIGEYTVLKKFRTKDIDRFVYG